MRALRFGIAVVVALSAAPARADEVPAMLQAQLLAKMSAYIVSGGHEPQAAKVLVVYPGPSESPSRGAQAFASALNQVGQFGSAHVEPKLLPFADEILGKKDAFRDPAIEVEIQPKLLAYWDELWLKTGGRRRGR